LCTPSNTHYIDYDETTTIPGQVGMTAALKIR
jgi:hypothetical protein